MYLVMYHVLGDEYHYVFNCLEFPGYFTNIDPDLSQIWSDEKVFDFFKSMSKTDYLRHY